MPDPTKKRAASVKSEGAASKSTKSAGTASTRTPRTRQVSQQRQSAPSERSRSNRGGARGGVGRGGRGRNTSRSAPKPLERVEVVQQPEITNFAAGSCGLCGLKAEHMSDGATLDQCPKHFNFFSARCSGLRWPTLCSVYHSSAEDQKEIDKACDAYETGQPMEDIEDRAGVKRTDVAIHETNQKYSLMDEDRLHHEMERRGVQLTADNISKCTDGILQAALPSPGTNVLKDIWVFPYAKDSGLPTYKLRSCVNASKGTTTLNAADVSLSKHAQLAFNNAITEVHSTCQVPEEPLLLDVGFHDFLGHLGPVQPGSYEHPTQIGLRELASRRTASPASVPVASPRTSPRSSNNSIGPKFARRPSNASIASETKDAPESEVGKDAAKLGEVPPHSGKIPKTVQDADEDAPPSDQEDLAAAQDLRKNRLRTDLWNSSVYGKMGNDRWQCERAARTWRRHRRENIAEHLDKWAEKQRSVENLSEDMINNTTRHDRDIAVDILIEEYGEVPKEVKPRLAVQCGYDHRDSSTAEKCNDMLDTTFPWCREGEKKTFDDKAPKNCHLEEPIIVKSKNFRDVVYIGFLKELIMKKGQASAACIVATNIRNRCEVILSQREFKPDKEELDIITDVITSTRFLEAINKEELLSDMAYVDACAAGLQFLNSTSIGKTFMGAIGTWVGTSPDLKALATTTKERIEGIKEAAKKLEVAQEGIDEHMLDPQQDTFNVEEVQAFSESLLAALKTISYSLGAKVSAVTTSISKELPTHIANLFEIGKKVLEKNEVPPASVLPHLRKVITEAAVVLPLEKRICELEQELCMLQRRSDMNEQKDEWARACKGVAKNLDMEALGAIDAACKKFEGAAFAADQNLSAISLEALCGVINDGISKFPEPGLREDLQGLSVSMMDLTMTDPAKDAQAKEIRLLVDVITNGVKVNKQCKALVDTEVDSFSDEHRARQTETLTLDASLRGLKSLLQEDLSNITIPHLKAEAEQLKGCASSVAIATEAKIQSKTEALGAVATAALTDLGKHLDGIKLGMKNGQDYRTSLPKSAKPTWKSYAKAIQETLGQSETCAGLDEHMANAKLVICIYFFIFFIYTFYYIYIYLYIYVSICVL